MKPINRVMLLCCGLAVGTAVCYLVDPLFNWSYYGGNVVVMVGYSLGLGLMIKALFTPLYPKSQPAAGQEPSQPLFTPHIAAVMWVAGRNQVNPATVSKLLSDTGNTDPQREQLLKDYEKILPEMERRLGVA